MRAPEHWNSAYYHCVSRVVGREYLLGDLEKDQLVKLMRKHEAFCLVKVVSFCVMDNHFHLLVEEPQGDLEMSDQAFLAHLKRTRPKQEVGEVAQKLVRWSKYADQAPAQELKASYLKRMGDVSFFMKGLKQEFTQWYNRVHKRSGTLWESRFKSVLINGMDAEALVMMSSYIDLNPVRAGIVSDPEEYRWCGFAAACAGNTPACEGVKQVVDTVNVYRGKESVDLKRSLESYYEQMAVRGPEAGIAQFGQPLRRGISSARIEEVLERKGKLTRQEALYCRVRHFCDGGVLGTQQSVDDVFEEQRWRFGAKRTSGARKIKCITAHDLCALRDLQVNLIG
jgi:REP element-mobilizing transposase RayT